MPTVFEFFSSSTVYIKLKRICFLGGGDRHLVGFLEVYRKFISWAVAKKMVEFLIYSFFKVP